MSRGANRLLIDFLLPAGSHRASLDQAPWVLTGLPGTSGSHFPPPRKFETFYSGLGETGRQPPNVLPGDENVSVPVTPLNFQSRFAAGYSALFADILRIMFGCLQRTIVEGLTAGAVKV
jgi:hypothetical protein